MRCCSTPAGAPTGMTLRRTCPASRVRASSSPSGWWTVVWRSPAATPGATGRSRRRHPTGRLRSNSSSTSATACSSSRTSTRRSLRATGCASSRWCSPTRSCVAPPGRGPRRSPSSRAAMDHYDVIIIGTGAGGGTLAHRLAPSGKKILLLERGGYLPREPENWDSREVFGRDRYVTTEGWSDRHGVAFRPHAQYFVGGNTKVYAGVLFRLRERDFQEVEHYGGVSPAWPISYADLEPYYTEAEGLYLVHGQAGEDPTEPPRSRPFPYPAVSHEPRIQQVHDDLVNAGHQPFHLPLAVDLDESDPDAGRCVRCNRFDGFPCPTDGKADAHVMCVRAALKHPNVTLRTHAMVQRLEADAAGRSVKRVVVDRGGDEEIYSADVVVVSCGVDNSASLL